METQYNYGEKELAIVRQLTEVEEALNLMYRIGLYHLLSRA